MILLDCKETTAYNHMKCIKKKYNTQFITKFHLAKYLGIDIWAMEASYQYRVKKNISKANAILYFRENNKTVKVKNILLIDIK